MNIRKKWIICCAAVLVTALVLIIFLLNRQPGQAQPAPSPVAAVPLVIDPNIGHTPTPTPPEPGVAIPGWGSITLPAGKTEAETDLFNPEANQGWYYLTFQLRLKDSGEVLFQTGLIPPGLYCTKVNLNRALEAGEYSGVMHVQPYYLKDPPSPTNNADFDIRIIVR